MVNWDKMGTRLFGFVFILVSIALVYWAITDFLYYFYINWFSLILPFILVPIGLWMIRTGGEDK